MKPLIIIGMICCSAVLIYQAQQEHKRILSAAELQNPEGLERAKAKLRSIRTGPLEITKTTMYVEKKEEKVEEKKDQDEGGNSHPLFPN